MMAPFYAGDEEEIIRPGARTLIVMQKPPAFESGCTPTTSRHFMIESGSIG